MRESMLLKTETGRTVGYLLTQGDEVRVRMDGIGERPLKIRYADGSMEEKKISCGRERRFSRNGKTLQSAVVLEEDRVTAATEKNLFCEKPKREKLKAPERTEPPRQKNDRKTEVQLTQTEYPVQPQARAWPQARWPKPPCMPSACYIQGKWTLSDAR